MKKMIYNAMMITVISVIALLTGSSQTLLAQCVEFQDPPLGATFNVGDAFVSEGVLIDVLRFQWDNGQWTYDGIAQIVNNGSACHAGQEMGTNNVNLAFNFGAPLSSLSLFYGSYGGNLNIEVNGTFQNFENFLAIHGSNIGGVYVSAPAAQGCGILTLTGTINSFFIGGQELWIDHLCYEEAVEDSCVDFEDLPPGATYHTWDSFLSEGAVITVREFQYANGDWTTDGFTDVSLANLACYFGKEMRVNNCNLEFNFGHAIDAAYLSIGEYGGNVNLKINGAMNNAYDFSDLDGLNIGGVDVHVMGGTGQDCGTMGLIGTIHVFSIGGQEFFIDGVCPGGRVQDDCVDFEDIVLGYKHYVGSTFMSEGYTFTVNDFQVSGGTWVSDGFTKADNFNMACHLGQDIWINNVNLEMNSGLNWPGLSLYFREVGGNLNIEVNGSFVNFENFIDIDATLIGGAAVSVTNGLGNDCGMLFLNGTITSFALGGQELWIDHICPEEPVEQGACCFADGSCMTTLMSTCITQGGTYMGDGTMCQGDNNSNGIDDACEITCVNGDANLDGVINVVDVLAVINHLLDLIYLPGNPLECADCNRDGIINVVDALGIVNVILGYGPCQPMAGKPEVTPEAMEFLKSLKSYLSDDHFDMFMTLVKAEIGWPTEYSLTQNYPNPFNPETTIEYTLPIAVQVKIEVYNLLGQVIEVLVDAEQEAGYHSVQWDASDLASGVYFYRLTAGNFTDSKRMVLMK